MTVSRRHLLAMALVILWIGAVVVGQEPNQAQAKLRFEISSEEQDWTPDVGDYELAELRAGSGIRPTHVAIMRTKYKRSPVTPWHEILDKPIGRAMSERQRKFITEGNILCERRRNSMFQYWWYAVSAEDAQKMAQAFVQILTEEAGAKVQEYKRRLREAYEEIGDVKGKLPQKQAEVKAAESKYKEVKNDRYVSLDDAEALEKAKEAMLQMGNMLDVLDIDLAGIHERLSAIKMYRTESSSRAVQDKLDLMFVEQMIELKSTQARKEATIRVRNREKAVLVLWDQWSTLSDEARTLYRSLRNSERTVRDIEAQLANPGPHMLPPKVFQNKVTIYPVSVD